MITRSAASSSTPPSSSPRLLVVLDFNGTLLDSTHRRRAGVTEDCMARFKFVYFRPGMREFVAWLISHPRIDVGVWTSNIAANAMTLVNIVFGDLAERRLKFIYSRDQCVVFSDYSSRKPVDRIFTQFSRYNESNTIFVDDSEDKVSHARAHEFHYRIPEFEASHASIVIEQRDPQLLRLRRHIERRLAEMEEE